MKFLLTMNIPYVPATGGANKSNRLLLERLVAKGHQGRAVVPAIGIPTNWTEQELVEHLRQTGAAPREVEGGIVATINGVEVHAVCDRARLRSWLREQIEDFQPDITLVSSEDPSHALLAAALELAPTSVIYIAITTSYLPAGPDAFFPSAKRVELLRRIPGIVTCSNFCVDYLKTWIGVDSAAVPLFDYGEPPFPQVGNFDSGAITLINACAVKGISIFLALARRFPQLPFLAVASWGTTDADRAELARLPNVTVMESTDDVESIYAQTRVLLVPSLWTEAFGRVSVEAMLRGIPVIASKVGGLPEAKLGVPFVIPVRSIERYGQQLDGNALPVPELSEQDLAPWVTTLESLVSNRQQYEELSQAGRVAALAHVESFSVEPFERYAAEVLARRHAPTVSTPSPSAAPDALAERLKNLSPQQRALLLAKLGKGKKGPP